MGNIETVNEVLDTVQPILGDAMASHASGNYGPDFDKQAYSEKLKGLGYWGLKW